MTTLVHDARGLREVLACQGELGRQGEPVRRGDVAVVMTMGALHEGHATLMREARSRVGDAGLVVVTVFVNPLQFGPGEDLDRYPRTRGEDLDVCSREGVDVMFAPAVGEVYPRTPLVTVEPGPLGVMLEGAHRPGHFAGVLTVVLKLLNLVRPDVAVFGEKDYQQLTLVRAMVLDLGLDVQVIGVPTVREPDGLALSSRNRFLSPDERHRALAISQALRTAAAVAATEPTRVLSVAQGVLLGGHLDLDYLELRAPDLGPPPAHGAGRLLVAARVGSTRLIDNVRLWLAGDENEGSARC